MTWAGATARRPALVALLVLLAATALEVTLASAPGLARGRVIAALVGLALGKALVIALVFMRLGRETGALRASVLVPLAFPFLYGLLLMADSAWRHLP